LRSAPPFLLVCLTWPSNLEYRSTLLKETQEVRAALLQASPDEGRPGTESPCGRIALASSDYDRPEPRIPTPEETMRAVHESQPFRSEEHTSELQSLAYLV